MKLEQLFVSCTLVAHSAAIAVHNAGADVTYQGIRRNGIDTFYSIPYGQDTGGANRFKPPRLFIATAGTTVQAQSQGAVCPQPRGDYFSPLYLSNVTDVSEDCLHLNIYRPEGISADANLPVMLHIHGGSFFIGSKDEIVIQPEGLVKRSVEMGQPIIFVTISYRLGVFGFAQSKALELEGSENAGLRDQRLSIEWTRDNMVHFGGNPSKITIAGQSSGGLAMGMQMMAYGGSRGFAFQQVSAESQILEGGITGEITTNAMQHVANDAACNDTDLQSAVTVECLRNLSMAQLLHSQIRTHHDGPASNIGDQWLPVVDGDFLPAAPSVLLKERRFANVTTMVGWCEDDATYFVPSTLQSNAEIFNWLSAFLPSMTTANVHKLLSLYPVEDFSTNSSANLTAQFYRAGRILRDLVFVCQPFEFGKALMETGNDVYFWVQNQTMFDGILTSLGSPGVGVVHTSNFAYQFNNLSHYDVNGWPYYPNTSDFALAKRQSASWASFTNSGQPSLAAHNILKGWTSAFNDGNDIDLYVIGGPHEGLSAIDGPRAKDVVADQKLRERCAFINAPEIIKQLDW